MPLLVIEPMRASAKATAPCGVSFARRLRSGFMNESACTSARESAARNIGTNSKWTEHASMGPRELARN